MSEFVWWPAKGYGFLAQDAPFAYDDRYLQSCRDQEETDAGQLLVACRCYFIERNGEHWNRRNIVDFGVGGGAFTLSSGCMGYDCNPKAIEMLKEAGRWHDLSKDDTDVICFWDSLEHLLSPEVYVKRARREVFISMPIYESAEHAFTSKHFKPNEHLWYFTERGLIGWMEKQGFQMVERNRDEERYGREGIGSYRFVRQS